MNNIVTIQGEQYEIASFSDVYLIPIARFFENQTIDTIKSVATLLKDVLLIGLPDTLIDENHVIRGMSSTDLRTALMDIIKAKTSVQTTKEDEIKSLEKRLNELKQTA